MPFNFVLFAFLDGVSPWWWVAFGLALGAAEVATGTTFLLGPAVAAFAVAGLLFVYPELGGTLQMTFFGVAVLASAVIAWMVTRRMTPSGGQRGLNRRGDALAGRMAEVTAPFRAGIGSVSIDGVIWRARLDGERAATAQPALGSALRVAGVEGATLIVELPDAN
ncbi:MAG: NfeD family protein [Pseudomonadota bacterium]